MSRPLGSKNKPRVSVLDLIEVNEPATIDGVPQGLGDKDKQMVAVMVGMGEGVDAVARKLGFPLEYVQAYVRSADGTNEIIRIQTALFSDPNVRVKKMAHMALDAQFRLLLKSDSDAVTARVAENILDRAGGKPTQKIETRSTISVTDMHAADRQLEAQKERLQRLESTRAKLLAARGVSVGSTSSGTPGL